MTRGAFIVFEGIDGSGKTTMVGRLWDAHSLPRFAMASQPSVSPAVVGIEKAINGDPIAAALWYAFDRQRQIKARIRPMLESGLHVVCDRYVWSSLAYQGADGVGLDWLEEINRHAPEPDFTVYLDVDLGVAFRRVEQRDGKPVPIETRRYLRGVSATYDYLVTNADVKRAIVIDADRDEDAVFADVLAAVTAFLATFDGEKPL